MSLDQKIEALLFYRAIPVKRKDLQKQLECSTEDIDTALAALKNRLDDNSALRLILTEDETQLVIAPAFDELIEAVRKEDYKREIGKAGAETLAIILYREPVSRAEIDNIRGVNSAFILRNLLIRGLITREVHPTDSRSFCYKTTPALLAHLGVGEKKDLQEYGRVMDALDQHEKEAVVHDE